MSAKWLQFCIGLNVLTHYVLHFLNNKYVLIHFKLFPCVDISQVQGIQLLNWQQFKQSFINGYSTWKCQILWDLELWKIVCDPPKVCSKSFVVKETGRENISQCFTKAAPWGIFFIWYDPLKVAEGGQDVILTIFRWWRHQMESFSTLLTICAGNSPVTGEFLAQRPVTRSFDVFSDLRLNKQLSKQPWGWWFETPSCPLWHHCNVVYGLAQDCSNSSALAMELLQSCAKWVSEWLSLTAFLGTADILCWAIDLVRRVGKQHKKLHFYFWLKSQN